MNQIKVDYIEHMGSDLTAVNAARVSYAKQKDVLDPKDEKLIKYLADHQHYSPFEHMFLTVKVRCPLFIRSQIVRHRAFSYNEVSRRYTAENIEFYEPTQYRQQHDKSKQCSDGHVDDLTNNKAMIKTQLIHKQCLDTYNEMLQMGVSREMARGILPQNLLTDFYMSGSLRNWIHFVKLRIDPHAQEEAQIVGRQCLDLLEEYFPISTKALMGEL